MKMPSDCCSVCRQILNRLLAVYVVAILVGPIGHLTPAMGALILDDFSNGETFNLDPDGSDSGGASPVGDFNAIRSDSVLNFDDGAGTDITTGGPSGRSIFNQAGGQGFFSTNWTLTQGNDITQVHANPAFLINFSHIDQNYNFQFKDFSLIVADDSFNQSMGDFDTTADNLFGPLLSTGPLSNVNLIIPFSDLSGTANFADVAGISWNFNSDSGKNIDIGYIQIVPEPRHTTLLVLAIGIPLATLAGRMRRERSSRQA